MKAHHKINQSNRYFNIQDDGHDFKSLKSCFSPENINLMLFH